MYIIVLPFLGFQWDWKYKMYQRDTKQEKLEKVEIYQFPVWRGWYDYALL